MPVKSPSLKSPLGRNIKRLREAHKLTQLALAHKIGMKGEDAGAGISRIESGLQEPRLDTLARIAKALGTTMGELLSKPLKK